MKQSAVSFLITSDEIAILNDVVYLEPYLEKVLSKVKEVKDGLRIKFPYDDSKDAINALEYQGKHESDFIRCQQLQGLEQKLKAYVRLRKYTML